MIENFIEISIKEPTDFLRIKETLTRIGIASERTKTLWQSCHILHKREKLYIVHFKELFALDGKVTNYSDEDRGRRNTIAHLLEEWGLCKIVNPDICKEPRTPLSYIKIITFKDKENWKLEPKYPIGRRV